METLTPKQTANMYTGTPVQEDDIIKTESIKRDLDNNELSPIDWKYYFTEPEDWGCEEKNSLGFNHGVQVISTTPVISKPLWVKTKEQRDQFRKIKGKFCALEDAQDEVEAFTGREEEDDGNFMML